MPFITKNSLTVNVYKQIPLGNILDRTELNPYIEPGQQTGLSGA